MARKMVVLSSCFTVDAVSVRPLQIYLITRIARDAEVLAECGLQVGTHSADFRAYKPLVDKYRILGFDFRGHGKSSCTPPYSFAKLVEDIEAFREHFSGHQQVVVAGGSFGGYLAQQVSFEGHPALTKR